MLRTCESHQPLPCVQMAYVVDWLLKNTYPTLCSGHVKVVQLVKVISPFPLSP